VYKAHQSLVSRRRLTLEFSRPGSIVSSLQSSRMKDMLIPVGCNELLDFVRRNHSATPEPSPLIVSSRVPTAAWRFIRPKNQCSMLVRGSEHSTSISTPEEFCRSRLVKANSEL
jgi:hypothetical protein